MSAGLLPKRYGMLRCIIWRQALQSRGSDVRAAFRSELVRVTPARVFAALDSLVRDLFKRDDSRALIRLLPGNLLRHSLLSPFWTVLVFPSAFRPAVFSGISCFLLSGRFICPHPPFARRPSASLRACTASRNISSRRLRRSRGGRAAPPKSSSERCKIRRIVSSS